MRLELPPKPFSLKGFAKIRQKRSERIKQTHCYTHTERERHTQKERLTKTEKERDRWILLEINIETDTHNTLYTRLGREMERHERVMKDGHIR